MKLTDDQVMEFLLITKRVFGITLSVPEARALATRFIHLVEVMTQGRRKHPRPEPQEEPSSGSNEFSSSQILP